MPRGSEHTGSHRRRNLGLAISQQQRFLATAEMLGFINQKLNRMLFRASHVEAQTVEDAAGADAHRLARQISGSHLLNERRGSSRRLQLLGNGSKSVLICSHKLPLELES